MSGADAGNLGSARASVTDPLVPVLAGLVVGIVSWLDECGDDEVDPDTAVKMMENVSWVLDRLPDAQRRRLTAVIGEMAAAEQDPVERRRLTVFPFASGLVEDEPELG